MAIPAIPIPAIPAIQPNVTVVKTLNPVVNPFELLGESGENNEEEEGDNGDGDGKEEGGG